MLDISPDKFWCSVVIVEHSQSTIHQGVVEMAGANVQGEDGVDEGEEQLMQQMLQCRSKSLAVVESLGMMHLVFGLVALFHGREIGLQQLFALSWRQFLARLHIFVASEARELSLAWHFSIIARI